MKNPKEYLQLFFEEKEIEPRIYEIVTNNFTHMMESERMIEIIINEIHEFEQSPIADKLVMIDFKNGDVHHFLEYLAKAYIATNYQCNVVGL